MNSIKVVLVEDDPMVLEVNSGFVKSIAGFRIVGVARTGADALRIIEETEPELVILDNYLPDFSGMELIKEFRKRGWPMDVITVTAAQDGKTLQHMLRFGVVDYIIKPFKFKRFQAALENYIKHRRLQAKDEIDQDDIDQVNARWYRGASEELPKNLNQLTLDQVREVLAMEAGGLTAEAVAERTGIARVTARRYLEHMEKTGAVVKDIQYGSVGRPVHRFRLI